MKINTQVEIDFNFLLISFFEVWSSPIIYTGGEYLVRLYPEKKKFLEKRKNNVLVESGVIFYACNEYLGRIFHFAILFEIRGRGIF